MGVSINMKKWLLGILAIGLIIWIGNVQINHNKSLMKTATRTESTMKGNNKMLIVYYSNSGTTEMAARTIQKQTGADIIKLQLDPAYPSDYDKLTVMAKHQLDHQIHPQILNKFDFSQYSTIFLGIPTWYHRPPMFTNTFFEKYDLKGKTVVPFTTSMSSSMAVSRPYLQKMTAGKQLTLQAGFRANDSRTITQYLQQHQLTK